MNISAVIITKDEAHNIARCIQSLVGVADEIIVVDSGSTDQTLQVARSMGAKVSSVVWQGYAQTKNYANSLATCEYILSIDADEALSEKLRESILDLKPRLSGAYQLNRRTKYCEKWINHCGWYPEYCTRLFPREMGYWEGKYVHEILVLHSSVLLNKIEGDLLHYSYQSIADHINRINHYSTLVAHAKYEKGKRATWGRILGSPIVRFLKMYVFNLGILDGYYGFIICKISAYEAFLRYIKLWELQRTPSKA